MRDTVHTSAWGDSYILLNPALDIDVNNSIKIRSVENSDSLLKLPGYEDAFPDFLTNAVGYVPLGDELVVLYWAKKCRSLLFIQNQLKASSDQFLQIIKKLQSLGILHVTIAKPEDVRKLHYLVYRERLEAPEHLNLRYQWNQTVTKFGGNNYIVDRNDNTTYTYREFDQIVKYITSTLAQNGFCKGDKILLHADTNFEAIALFWACMQLGIVYVPVNALLAETVIEGLIETHRPKAIFLSHEAAFRKKWRDKIIFFDSETSENQATGDKLFFSEWLEESQEIENLTELNENDLAVILNTSGSTGLPKGVKLSHGQLVQSARNMVNHFCWSESDRYLAIADLDSMSGLRNTCISTVTAGATCVIPGPGEKGNRTNLLNCVGDSRVTILVAVPPLLNLFLNKNEIMARLQKVRCVLSTGSNLSTQLKTEFFKRTGKKIYNYYGLTETAGLCIAERFNDSRFSGGFIGYPVDCVIRIVDENNKEVKTDEPGELVIYSYCISNGYYTRPEQSADWVQRWFFTGDLVKMASDGGIELIGRKSDYIKNTRGEIVYFIEVENVITKLPFISDFGMLSFFKDESESAALFLEVNGTLASSENVIEKVKKELIKTIGYSKIPSTIKVLEKIPRSKNGKLLKADLHSFL